MEGESVPGGFVLMGVGHIRKEIGRTLSVVAANARKDMSGDIAF
jgi:hypothetical protein